MLGCYIDDSADHGRKTVLSVAGFVGESEKWFDFERHWDRALKNAGLEYFRTYECVNLEGEFRRKLVDVHGLTTARVIANALLADIQQIVATSDLYAFSTAVLMAGYRQVLSEPDGAIVLNPDPYIYAHYQLIGTVLDQFLKFKRYEVCAFLYDESSKASLMQSGWEGFKKETRTGGDTRVPLSRWTIKNAFRSKQLTFLPTPLPRSMPQLPFSKQKNVARNL